MREGEREGRGDSFLGRRQWDRRGWEGAEQGKRFSSGGGAGIGWRRCGEEGGVSHPVFSLG